VEGYDAETYGDRFADVYDDWYEGITDADACADLVAAVAAAAGGGPVLELGVGTGRLALPLGARGLDVVGLDASAAMLERLAAKVASAGLEGRVRGVRADMAAPPPMDPRPVVVLAAYNTLFNLTDVADQRRCLTACRERLAPGGSVVVEAFVPVPGQAVEAVTPRTIAADRVVLSVSRADDERQEVLGQFVDITEAGIRLRPWHIRWSTPAQLDALAAEAGLVLAERWGGWDRSPFDEGSRSHVSRYVVAP
jgi:SAM-dependent methyltransferase